MLPDQVGETLRHERRDVVFSGGCEEGRQEVKHGVNISQHLTPGCLEEVRKGFKDVADERRVLYFEEGVEDGDDTGYTAVEILGEKIGVNLLRILKFIKYTKGLAGKADQLIISLSSSI